MPSDTTTLPPLPPLPAYPPEPGAQRDEWHRLVRLHTDAASIRAQQARADAEQAVAEAGKAAAEAQKAAAAAIAQPPATDPAWLAATNAHAAAIGRLAVALSRGGEVSGADAVIAAHVRGIALELRDAAPPAAA